MATEIDGAISDGDVVGNDDVTQHETSGRKGTNRAALCAATPIPHSRSEEYKPRPLIRAAYGQQNTNSALCFVKVEAQQRPVGLAASRGPL